MALPNELPNGIGVGKVVVWKTILIFSRCGFGRGSGSMSREGKSTDPPSISSPNTRRRAAC